MATVVASPPGHEADVPSEIHTDSYCLHPYFGYVCTPGRQIDFSDGVPAHFGHGARADIDRDGFRNTGLPSIKPADEFWIGLFGGSVAFSAPASSNETTIAACLERQLNLERGNGSARVRVVDLSLPACQQPQQLLIMTMNLERLDGVVTFDGVNEFIVPAWYNVPAVPAGFPYRPFYEALYGREISEQQIALSWLLRDRESRFAARPRWAQALGRRRHQSELRRLRAQLRAPGDRAARFRSLFPIGAASTDEAVARGATNWKACTSRMNDICRATSIQALFTVQPVPERAKPLTPTESEYLRQVSDIVDIRRRGYDQILVHARALETSGVPVHLLTDVFANVAEEVYTDQIHFEDRGCSIVAAALATRIRAGWRLVPRAAGAAVERP